MEYLEKCSPVQQSVVLDSYEFVCLDTYYDGAELQIDDISVSVGDGISHQPRQHQELHSYDYTEPLLAWTAASIIIGLTVARITRQKP